MKAQELFYYYIGALKMNVDDAIFELLQLGYPPSEIPPIKDYDYSEVVRFLCSYCVNKK